MKTLYILLVAFFLTPGLFLGKVNAQESVEGDAGLSEIVDVVLEDDESLDPALVASEEASVASEAASIVKKITEKSSDLTETEGEAKGKLENLVLSNVVGPLRPTNFLRWSIRAAVGKEVPANTIVLVLMFPLITALIAASRHLIGLRGFGIFTPAIVAVALLATGIVVGFSLLFLIVVIATLSRVVIKRLRLPYMPRTSLMLWVVSMVMLAVLLISPFVGYETVAKLSIFPLLLMVLLAETFMDVQTKRSRNEAIEMTLETLLLATVSYFVMNLQIVQEFVLFNPELTVLGVAIFNIFLGKFQGLRLIEYWRFRTLLDN